jgi:hypothetical protein
MHLPKPVEPDELVKVVARLAGRETTPSAVVPDSEPAPVFGP